MVLRYASTIQTTHRGGYPPPLRSERYFVFHLQQEKRRALNGVLRHRARVEGECSVLLSGRQGRFRPPGEPLIEVGHQRTVIDIDHATSRPIDHVSGIAAFKVNKVPDQRGCA
jgi:hypothetical protein